MPRRDGFPTNPEMLLNFNAASHKVFVTAYERALEGKLPAGYIDKPLLSLTLSLRQGSLDQSQPVTGEELKIGILSQYVAEDLPYNFTCARHPEQLLDRYVEVSKSIGAVALNDELIMADNLPTEGIDADYVLTYADGKMRHVSSFKEKPAKQSIVAGTYFAEEALQYVQSEQMFRTPAQNVVRRLVQIARTGNIEDMHIMSHRFDFKMTPDLPLNGYESKAFLERYTRNMFAIAMRHRERLSFMQAHGSDVMYAAPDQQLYDEYNSAYLRAQILLDKK